MTGHWANCATLLRLRKSYFTVGEYVPLNPCGSGVTRIAPSNPHNFASLSVI
jgi:hypothetical protein